MKKKKKKEMALYCNLNCMYVCTDLRSYSIYLFVFLSIASLVDYNVTHLGGRI